MTGPFASVAIDYAKEGLHPFPTGGDDGKKPLVRNWQKCRSLETIEKFAERFPAANVGIPTGPATNLTVVDCDDRDLAGEMIQRCGDTDLIVKSPRGLHLYYRHSGEMNVQGLDGAKVDIRGFGGLILAPPSIRPDSGQEYETIMGRYEALDRLPEVNPGSLPLYQSTVIPCRPGAIGSDVDDMIGGPVEGTRNLALFTYLRGVAFDCSDESALIDQANEFNRSCRPPLPNAEVLGAVQSVWRYRMEGRLAKPGEHFAMITDRETGLLFKQPDAVLLLVYLRQLHGSRRKPFALVPEKCAPIFGISRDRIRAARNQLVDAKLLHPVNEGGKGMGDPATFLLHLAP